MGGLRAAFGNGWAIWHGETGGVSTLRGERAAEDDEEMKEVLARSSKAIGGWKFCRWAENAHRGLRQAGKAETDVAMRRIEAGSDPEDVFRAICKGFGVDREKLKKRRSLGDARLVAGKRLNEKIGHPIYSSEGIIKKNINIL